MVSYVNRRFLFLCIGLLLSKPVWAIVPVDESWVRLRLYENIKKISLVGSNIEVVQKAESFRNVSITLSSRQKIDIQFQQKWNQSFLITKFENQVSSLKSKSLFLKGDGLSIRSIPVASFLQIYKRSSGFDIIGYIKLRDYLRGVVTAEMPAHWPRETLKAQIVAARSYALFMTEKRKKYVFDLEASIKDQAYEHTLHSTLDPLLDETANLVLFDQNNSLFKTYYHSECGGQTSSAKKIFGDSNFDEEVKDPYCRGRSWQLKISRQEIENYFGPFKSLVTPFDPLKRAYTVKIQRPDLSLEDLDAQKLRLIIGSSRMKSTWFEKQDEGNVIVFKGKGYGHGVGLCQWGSRQMGLMKKNFQDILNFYYPKSLLRAVNSERSNF